MDYRNKRYLVGGGMIFLQYLLMRFFYSHFQLGVSMRNVSFFIFIFLYIKEDIYSLRSYLIWEEIRKQFKCWSEYLVITGIIVYQIYGLEKIVIYWIIGTISVLVNLIIGKVIRKIFYDSMKNNLLILGVGENAQELEYLISQNNFTMYNLIGFLKIDSILKEKIEVNESKILGNYEIAEKIIKEKKITEIIIAVPHLGDKEMAQIIEKIEGKVQNIKFIPKINKMYTFNPIIQDYDGIMLISIKNKILSRKRKVIKRIGDIILGIIGTLLLCPLSFVIWYKTGRKEKEEGIFYTQSRIGYKGAPIKIYKYRSMVVGAEKILKELIENNPKIKEEYEKNKKLKNDPRITKIGAFLRRTSLDEFPQFLNIIKGEMSFIGPRPYLFGEKEDMGNSYNKIIEFKPGITGMWQTHGRSDTDFKERLLLDEYYYRNWSLGLDMIIFIKTIKDVIRKKGAY